MRNLAPELASSSSEDPAVLSKAATEQQYQPLARPRLPLATPVMPWQQSPVVVLFVSLTVILHYDNQVRAKEFPETTDSSQPMRATTVQATAKLFLQPTKQVPSKTTGVRSTDGHITSQLASTASNSEIPTTHTTVKTLTTTSLVTTNSAQPTSQTSHTLVTTLATPNNSHTPALVTEATTGPSIAPRSPRITPPAHTTGTSPSTVSHTTGQTPQPSNQTTLSVTLITSPRNSTTSQKPTQPTQAPGTTTAAPNATQTASSPTTTPGPTLAPQPSTAKTGIYQVLNGSRLCIKAEMGLELALRDTASVFSPQRYFNIDPNTTQASGHCGFRVSNLLLNFQGGFVNLTFTKDENSYYINEVKAYLTVSNPENVYHGMKSAMMMFETMVGHSFKCVSEQSIQLSAQLQLKTINVQLQAFDFEDDLFGNVDECSSDYTIVLPVIGAIVLGLCAVGLTVYGIRLKRESSGYQRL